MPTDTLQTERLILRPFQRSDIPAYQAIRRKPGVTRFLPSHTVDPQEADRRAAAGVESFIQAWADDGYGPWAMTDRDGVLMGHLGLRVLPEMGGQTELLYLLDPVAQGRGLVAEGARAALTWGFSHLGPTRVLALAMPDNAGSLAVMDRLGMQRPPGNGLVDAFGMKVVQSTIDAADWSAR